MKTCNVIASIIFSLISSTAFALNGILESSFRDASTASLGAYTHLKFPSWGQRTHFGNDVLADCGSTIYAPGSGVVEDVVRSSSSNFDSLGNAVIIRHQGGGRGGSDIFSLFLHMRDSPLVNIGDLVTVGTKIGVVGKTGSANNICHSHVELRYFASRFSPQYNNIYASGDVRNNPYALDNWENPNAFILPLIPYSMFDGSGSLIDPTASGDCAKIKNFGCSKDVVKLHGHDIPSTGVFQVLSQQNYCDYVRLTGTGKFVVGVKRWNEAYPGNTDGLSTIYRIEKTPANIKIPFQDWSLVSVTTMNPITQGTTSDIGLECVAGSFTPNKAQVVDIAPPVSDRAANPSPLLVTLGSGYYWSGSGSLIKQSGNISRNDTTAGYGRTKDEAIKLTSKKSFISYQIQSDGVSCKNIKISDAAGTSGQSIQLYLKRWNDPDWGQPLSNSSLPANISIPTAGYWIVKLKPQQIGWLKIRAECI